MKSIVSFNCIFCSNPKLLLVLQELYSRKPGGWERLCLDLHKPCAAPKATFDSLRCSSKHLEIVLKT